MLTYNEILNKLKIDGIQLCGCIGPQNNDPYCPCKMERIKKESQMLSSESLEAACILENNTADPYLQTR